MPTMTLEKLAIMVAEGFIEVHQKIDGVARDVEIIKQDVAVLKQDVLILKQDASILKHDVKILKQDMTEMKAEIRLQNSTTTTLTLRTDRLEKKVGI